MKILYITHYFRNSNSATLSTCEIVKTLTSLGNDVIILTQDSYTIETEAKVCHVLPRMKESIFIKIFRCTLGYFFILFSALKLSRSNTFEAVFSQHHNFHLASVTGYIIASFLRIPLVVKIHDVSPWANIFLLKIYNQGLMKALNGIALRHAEAVLSLTSEIKKLLKTSFSVSDRRLYILGNIIDSCNPTITNQTIMALRNQLSLGHKKVLLFLGETTERGIELIIQTLPIILSYECNIRLVVVGSSRNRKELEELAENLGVRRYIIFVGKINHDIVPAYLSIADIGIGPLTASPLTLGACPRKVLEYMAYGKPVIAVQGTVSNDLIIDGYNGLLAQNKTELASKILNLIEDPVLARKIGENGKNHVRKYFSQTTSKKIITELLKEIRH